MGNLRQELNDKAVVFADPIQVEPDDSAAVACAVDVQQLFPARKKACVNTDGFQIFEAFRVAIASENPELSVLYADSQRYAAVALIRGVQRSIGVVCESVQRVQIFDLAGNINIDEPVADLAEGQEAGFDGGIRVILFVRLFG